MKLAAADVPTPDTLQKLVWDPCGAPDDALFPKSWVCGVFESFKNTSSGKHGKQAGGKVRGKLYKKHCDSYWERIEAITQAYPTSEDVVASTPRPSPPPIQRTRPKKKRQPTASSTSGSGGEVELGSETEEPSAANAARAASAGATQSTIAAPAAQPSVEQRLAGNSDREHCGVRTRMQTRSFTAH